METTTTVTTTLTPKEVSELIGKALGITDAKVDVRFNIETVYNPNIVDEHGTDKLTKVIVTYDKPV